MGNVSKTFNLATKKLEKIDALCKECNRETLHSVIASFDVTIEEDFSHGNWLRWDCQYQTIQCQGCQTVSFRTVSTSSEEELCDHEGNSFHPETIKYYPSRTKGVRAIDSFSLPSEVRQIYRETILAIENEQYIIAGMGVRAIIETICKNREAMGDTLFEKIDWLKEQSLVTSDGCTILHKLRILGNQAAHEVKAHDSSQLELAMKIIEHLLEATYIFPGHVRAAFPSEQN